MSYSQQKHIINKLQVDVVTQNPSTAFDLKDHLDTFLKHEIFPYLENYFGSLEEDLQDQIIQIPYLSVDVDTSSALNYNELKEDVKRALVENIEKLTRKAHPQNEEATLLTTAKSKENQFFHFLERGALPWWNHSEDSFEISEEDFENLIASESFPTLIKKKLMKKAVKKRIIQQLSDEQLKRVWETLVQEQSAVSISPEVVSMLPQVSTEMRQIVWNCLIDFAIQNDLETLVSRLLFSLAEEVSESTLREQISTEKQLNPKTSSLQLISNLLINLPENTRATQALDIIQNQLPIVEKSSADISTTLANKFDVESGGAIKGKDVKDISESEKTSKQQDQKGAKEEAVIANNINDLEVNLDVDSEFHLSDSKLSKVTQLEKEADKITPDTIAKTSEETISNVDIKSTTQQVERSQKSDQKDTNQSSKKESVTDKTITEGETKQKTHIESKEEIVSHDKIISTSETAENTGSESKSNIDSEEMSEAIFNQVDNISELEETLSEKESLQTSSETSQKESPEQLQSLEKNHSNNEIIGENSQDSDTIKSNVNKQQESTSQEISKENTSSDIENTSDDTSTIGTKVTSQKASEQDIVSEENSITKADQNKTVSDIGEASVNTTKETIDPEGSQETEANKISNAKDQISREEASNIHSSEEQEKSGHKALEQEKSSVNTDQESSISTEELSTSLNALVDKQDQKLFKELHKSQLENPIQMEERGEYQISNAGLMMLHPYFKQLFEICDLLNDDNTINNPDVAVHLLHYLATKKEQQFESNMLFEKILCGVHSSTPIRRNIVLSDEHKNNAEQLLEVVLEQWGVLKNSSPDLLRNEFLQRLGTINFKQPNPKIKVERKVQDILLDRLPWGIGICRLPWLNYLLFTDW